MNWVGVSDFEFVDLASSSPERISGLYLLLQLMASLGGFHNPKEHSLATTSLNLYDGDTSIEREGGNMGSLSYVSSLVIF